MQKSQGPKSMSRRRPLRVLSNNKARHLPESARSKPRPPAAHPPEPVGIKLPPPAAAAAAADAALDRLLLARSDLDGIVSQIDELISEALQCETVSTSGKQVIESFGGFLSDTNSSLKQWFSRLKQALESHPAKTGNAPKHNLDTSSVAGFIDKLFCSRSSNVPDTDPVATPSCNLLNCSSSNLLNADMIVSPSPLVAWRTGACMPESGKQLFLLTPLPKTKACSSRCPTTKSRLKMASSMGQLDLPSLPVWKLAISDDDHHHPDQEQGVKVKEAGTSIMTPHVTAANTDSLEDRLRSPCTFSVQKDTRALPKSCLKTALSSKQQLFSSIPEGSKMEDFSSDEPTLGAKRSEACDDVSSDEVSKDLASRYDLYGLNQSTKNTYHRRKADDTLQWFLSPPKTCVLMGLSDEKPIPTPAGNNMKGMQDVSDDKPIETPAVHSKALLATPWKGLESTNLKGRRAGETTLKRELWTRFEAASTNELHLNKSAFQKLDGKRFMDMLEEAE